MYVLAVESNGLASLRVEIADENYISCILSQFVGAWSEI